MIRDMLPSNQELKVGSAVSPGEGFVVEEDLFHPEYLQPTVLEEVLRPGEPQLALLKTIAARLDMASPEKLAPAVSLLGHLIPNAERCVILLFDSTKHRLRSETAVNLTPEFVLALDYNEQRTCLLTTASEQANSSLVIYLPGNKQFSSLWRLANREDIKTLWLIPWRDRDGSLLGAILFGSAQAFSPSKSDLTMVTLLTGWMSTALQEAQARQDNERFRAAFDNCRDTMMIVDDTNRIIAVNHAMEKLTGWRQDETAGQHYEQTLRRFASSEEGEDTVFHDLIPPSSVKGSNRYRIITVRDSSLQEQQKHIKPDVMSVLSHELLSPLTLIKGYTATLLQLGDDFTKEQKKKYILGIDSATNKLTRLLENFRDIARLESSTSDLAVQSTSLPDLLRKTISGIQNQTTKHVIKLRLSRPLPPVNVDRQKIEQVITNLLLNAIKYFLQGGDIEVSVKQARDREKLREILGEASQIKPPCLVVTVTDYGAGIPEEDLERVFDKFYRVDNRLTRASSGAGLGLYICKIIVEAHGGHIWATSRVGEGSTFGFSLPLD